ncbi:unnamed protein product [Closterium sp. NIES-65]|nr:unnamed protein product [Closterium sp. NIES-65]
MMKRQRNAISAKEKLHWLKMQDSQPDLSNRALAKLAKVQPCQIHEWKKMRERLEVASSCRRRLMGHGRKSKYPFMERAVYRHFLKHRAKGLAVTVSMLQKWSAKYMKHKMPGLNWRASFRWATRVVVRAQEKGWMDEALVQDWITQVMVPFLKPLRETTGRRREGLVVLDSYRGHLTEAVGQTMRMFRLSRAVIPGGCTPLVQPLDVSVNRAFKCGVRHRYSLWFEEEGINLTTKADRSEVEVLDDVNDLVDDETVVNPFYAEVPMPAEELRAAAHEEDAAEEDAEAAAAEEEGVVLEEGGEAEEPSDDEWWRPGRYDGEECDEWHAGDDSE